MNKKIRLIIILVMAFAVCFAIIFPALKGVFLDKTKQETQFTVDQGQGVREIGANLKKEKLIDSEWLFSFLVLTKHWYLQSGVYKIKSGMNMLDLAQMFHEGKVEQHLITIPEGWRVTQIDQELADKGLIQKGSFTKIASANEGYLFPDSYKFPLEITADQIKKVMMDNFTNQTQNLKISKQTIILASIVERESKTDLERPKIAAVYLNRLKIGMRLEADPTIQYGKGNWNSISSADYKNFESAYNTYMHDGLPPGPICNPGLKSIEAVLYPEKHDYYFFFHNDKGEIILSKTYEEHLKKLAN